MYHTSLMPATCNLLCVCTYYYCTYEHARSQTMCLNTHARTCHGWVGLQTSPCTRQSLRKAIEGQQLPIGFDDSYDSQHTQPWFNLKGYLGSDGMTINRRYTCAHTHARTYAHARMHGCTDARTHARTHARAMSRRVHPDNGQWDFSDVVHSDLNLLW